MALWNMVEMEPLISVEQDNLPQETHGDSDNVPFGSESATSLDLIMMNES